MCVFSWQALSIVSLTATHKGMRQVEWSGLRQVVWSSLRQVEWSGLKQVEWSGLYVDAISAHV